MGKKCRVVCMGDSITAGFGLGDDASVYYPSRLQHYLGDGYQVFNQGVSGCCVTNVLVGNQVAGYPYVRQEKYRDALVLKGDIYVIMLGTNDAKDGEYEDKSGFDPLDNMISYRENFLPCYQDIIDDVREVNPDSIIYIVRPIPIMDCKIYTNHNKYLEMLFPYMRELVLSNRGLRKIDLYRAFMDVGFKERVDLYQDDGLHPNEKGADLIAKIIADEMIHRCKEEKISTIAQ